MNDNLFRFSFIAILCTIPIGTFYYYDFPGALSPRFQHSAPVCNSSSSNNTHECFDFDPFTYNLLYTVAAGANGVLALFGGLSADAFGAHRVIIFYIALSTLGAFMFASAPLYLGASSALVPVMIVARAFLGAPMGAMRASQNKLAQAWAEPSGKRAVALSATDMSLRIGTLANFLLTPSLADWFGLYGVLWVGPVLCSLGFVAAIVVYYTHRRYADRMQAKSAVTRTKIKLSDVKKFPLLYWLVVVQGALLISAFMPLIGNLTMFFQIRYFYESHQASQMIAACYFVALGMPLFGLYVVDRYGRQAQWLIVSTAVLVIAFILCYVATTTNPYPHVPWFPPLATTIAMGLVYSVWTTSWVSAIAIVAPRGHEALSFAIPFSMFDFGSSVSALVVGRILQKSPSSSSSSSADDVAHKYSNMLLYFTCLAFASLVFALLAYARDRMTTQRIIGNQKLLLYQGRQFGSTSRGTSSTQCILAIQDGSGGDAAASNDKQAAAFHVL